MKNLVVFGQEVRQEAQKVTWPSFKETWLTTLMVFIMVLLSTVVLYLFDKLFETALAALVGRF